jgi:predicted O-methyltransferase YrrM
MNRKRLADGIVPFADFALLIVAIPAAVVLKFVRRLGLSRLRLTRAALLRIGLLPVRDHYYEPFIDPRRLRFPLERARYLPGINLNVDGQLRFLSELTFQSELTWLDLPQAGSPEFRLGNQSFESGDAEYLYQLIRRTKPTVLIEIGSGQSTLMAQAAIRRNASTDPYYQCRHICIEPYEAPWLEKIGVEVLRQQVENVDISLFRELGPNDLLFIDSSHVIRPQGDVLTEYLQILPSLKSGVIVHIHDVFTPRDYLNEWIIDSLQMWNEQYLMEAFLCNNSEWTVLGAVNYLKENHFSALSVACPYVTKEREPGSFYIRKN